VLLDDRLLGLRQHEEPGRDLLPGGDLRGQMRVQQELLAAVLDLLLTPFPEPGASPAVLCPAAFCARATLRDAQCRRPDRSRPLHASQAQSCQLGRARPRPKVHSAGGHCGGDIRLIAFITEPGPIRKILTHLGEPLEPPPVSPARGPPTDWGELVQAHNDRDVFQASPVALPAIDIHSL
jgi:hypothetical protein